ncbi:helix-turn-helix transcriptional regulator [Alicyclobacillus acidiphilus]|uniref:helix-turn-helix transcriptional regulator n=1 Tax=Alicyclobacillus acidiphilus TaxID=182455 RepID=UPI000831CB98|nr:helix-turn-helix transcriptional regulator [Alicyclobacillus acidiphilus]
MAKMNEPWLILEEARKQNGFTQAQWCEGVCAQSQYSLIEQGVLVPDDTLMDAFLHRLALPAASREDLGEVWRQHRRAIELQIRWWRAFVRGSAPSVAFEAHGFEADGQGTSDLTLEAECYSLWWLARDMSHRSLGRGADADPDPVACKVSALWRRVISESHHIPRHMRALGDLRLRVVLASVEAMAANLHGRHQSSCLWLARANDMILQIPSYWV